MKRTSTRVSLFLAILFCLALSSPRPPQLAAAVEQAPDIRLAPPEIVISCIPGPNGRYRCGTGKATLTNEGSEPVTITSISTNNPAYSQSNNCSTTLGAGRSCTLRVSYSPLRGNIHGKLEVGISGLGSLLTVVLFADI
jgi:hypothetical protein